MSKKNKAKEQINGRISVENLKKLSNWRLTTASGEEIKQRRTMRFWFSCVMLVLFATTCGFTAAVFYIINGILDFYGFYMDTAVLIGAIAFSCILVGAIVSSVTSKFILNRISKISRGMLEISKGNYKMRVEEKDTGGALSEFGALEKTFNQMAADLDGIEMFRNDFINNFSHEFKTPIVSIRGFARQLQSGTLTDEQRDEYIGIIVSESERLSNMSNNVLLLSKLENQQIVSDKTTFDLDEQIRNCILLLEKSWSDKNIELDFELDDVKFTFNEEMLSHVWINLFSNAIKFTGEGGRIACRLYKTDDRVVCTVSDSGIGMSREVIGRIFEKFYQGDASHSSFGNGIGLNIVKRIITLANGSIEVESEIGVGSTFTVTLPR